MTNYLLYDESLDRYFDDEDDAYLYYWDNELKPPEFLYGTKRVEFDTALVERAAERLIEYIDESAPEFSTEDDSFAGMLHDDETALIEDLIGVWLKKTIKTFTQDSSKKYPTAEAFAAFVKEQEAPLVPRAIPAVQKLMSEPSILDK